METVPVASGESGAIAEQVSLCSGGGLANGDSGMGMVGLAHSCQRGHQGMSWESLGSGLVSVGKAPCSQTPRGHSASCPSYAASQGGRDALGTQDRKRMVWESHVLSLPATSKPSGSQRGRGAQRSSCISSATRGPLPGKGGCSDGAMMGAEVLGWRPWLGRRMSRPFLQHESGLTRHLLGVTVPSRHIAERNKTPCPEEAHPSPGEPETLGAGHQPGHPLPGGHIVEATQRKDRWRWPLREAVLA